MANMGFNFDANNVDPQQAYDPLPAGEYVAAITESDMVATKSGTGEFLAMTLEVLEGPYQGRKLFDRLNLDNPNPKAVAIAQSTLSAICHAVGVLNVSDSQQLHDRPMLVKVKVKPADGQYEASNEIKGYKATNGKAPVTARQQGDATSQAGQAEQPKTNKPVWAA